MAAAFDGFVVGHAAGKHGIFSREDLTYVQQRQTRHSSPARFFCFGFYFLCLSDGKRSGPSLFVVDRHCDICTIMLKSFLAQQFLFLFSIARFVGLS